MQTINPNLSTMEQLCRSGAVKTFNPTNSDFNGIKAQFCNDTAFQVASKLPQNFDDFDAALENIWGLKNIVNAAQSGISSMIQQGESIRDLVLKAQEENLSPESLDAIENEVKSRLEQIKNIKNNTFFNEINPFDGAISLNIPNFQDIFRNWAPEKIEEEDNEENFNEIASFQIDMAIDAKANGTGFNAGASATIKIGYTDEGALQIVVDASMDFDLSELEEKGVKSENAFDIINNFLSLLTGKRNELENASEMFNSMFASGSASIIGDGFGIEATNDINLENESSKKLKGKIVQHAKITLDSTANQSPSIAINLL